MESAGINWQTTYSINKNTGYCWQITSLYLQLFRHQKEWLICWNSDPTNESREVSSEALSTEAEPKDDIQREHYVVQASSGKARLIPKTADRPVVIRPRNPFILPSHEEATLFVSTPLWIEIAVGDPAKALKEMPVKAFVDGRSPGDHKLVRFKLPGHFNHRRQHGLYLLFP